MCVCAKQEVELQTNEQPQIDAAELAAYRAQLRKHSTGKGAKLAAAIVVLSAVGGVAFWCFGPDRYTYQEMNLGMFGVQKTRTSIDTGKTEVFSCGERQSIDIDGSHLTIPAGTRLCL